MMESLWDWALYTLIAKHFLALVSSQVQVEILVPLNSMGILTWISERFGLNWQRHTQGERENPSLFP